MFFLSGSGNGDTVKNKPYMNAIAHGTHHPVSVCDIYNVMAICKDGRQTTYKFISEYMMVMVDEIDSGK